MQWLKDFWSMVVEVWQHGLYGIDIGSILLALVVLALCLLLRKLFTRIVINRLKAVTKHTKTQLDDQVFQCLEGPIRFIPVVLGVFLAVEILPLADPSLVKIGDNIVRTMIIIAIFWGLVRLVGPLSFVLRKLEKVFTPAMVDWLIKAIRIAVVFIGAATILELWGIQVGPILAGLGLLGVAVALGAQDLFKNLISGLLILAEKRYHKGDWIKVDGVVEGTVEYIGFRSTLVRRFDKAPVFVPNSSLSDNAVTNFSAMTHRRIYWKIGVLYSSTIEQLRLIRDRIEAYILENDAFAKPPEVATFVRIDAFSDSSIDIMLYCFTRTTVWGEWLQIKEELAYKVKEIVEGAGSGFAFPSTSLYVETLPTDAPEPFVPPSE